MASRPRAIDLQLCRSIVFVKDMEKMTAFYRDVLSLAPQPGEYPTQEWLAFDAGPVQLALHRIPEPWNSQITIDEPPSPRAGAATKLVFLVENLEEARDELLARGVRLSDNPNLNAPGEFVRCDFLDPEGNVFQLTVVEKR